MISPDDERLSESRFQRKIWNKKRELTYLFDPNKVDVKDIYKDGWSTSAGELMDEILKRKIPWKELKKNNDHLIKWSKKIVAFNPFDSDDPNHREYKEIAYRTLKNPSLFSFAFSEDAYYDGLLNKKSPISFVEFNTPFFIDDYGSDETVDMLRSSSNNYFSREVFVGALIQDDRKPYKVEGSKLFSQDVINAINLPPRLRETILKADPTGKRIVDYLEYLQFNPEESVNDRISTMVLDHVFTLEDSLKGMRGKQRNFVEDQLSIMEVEYILKSKKFPMKVKEKFVKSKLIETKEHLACVKGISDKTSIKLSKDKSVIVKKAVATCSMSCKALENLFYDPRESIADKARERYGRLKC